MQCPEDVNTSVHEAAVSRGVTSADVDPEAVTALAVRVSDVDGLRDLVLRAFDMARRRNPDQWRTMTVAVLKNRLLQMTDRQFRETEYGARDMVELAGLLPELDVDTVARPPAVTLQDSSVSEASSLSTRRVRIRPDLWNAVMDYASGRTWVWSDGHAVAVGSDEVGDMPVLPTLTADEMRQWREGFVAEQSVEPNGQRLDDWAAGSGGTYQLPPHLRGRWNDQLKRGVVDRLDSWFESRAEPRPADVVVAANRYPAGDKAQAVRPSGLRTFVTGCVAVMTDNELAALGLPAAAVQRYLEYRAVSP